MQVVRLGMSYLYMGCKVERVITTNHSNVRKTVDTPLPAFLQNELAIKSVFVKEGER